MRETGVDDREIRFCVLGPVRAWAADAEIDLGPAKQRAVLAMLLLRLGEPVPTARIVDAVWGDEPPASGANVVQKYVAGLRRVLEPERVPGSAPQLLTLSPAGYVLSPGAGAVDARCVDAQVARARELRADGRPAEAAEVLTAALAAWQGEPLAGLTGPFFAGERRRLEESRAGATEALAEAELALERHESAVARLRRLVADHPGRERPRELLMLALYRSGRQAEALAAYRDARGHLIGEFGTEPSPALRELHQRMLNGDPALLPLPAGRPGTAVPTGPPVHFQVHSSGRTLRFLGRLAAVAVPLLTVGFGTWLGFAVLAMHRRRPALFVSAAAYFAVICTAFTLAGESDVESTSSDLGVVLILGCMLLGAGHLTWVVFFSRGARTWTALPMHVDRRREIARYLAVMHPEAARVLAVGRPDLPRMIDDGGLVDVNSAPHRLLADLPGITTAQAVRIVSDRETHGPLQDVGELVSRELLLPHVAARLADVLVAVPV